MESQVLRNLLVAVTVLLVWSQTVSAAVIKVEGDASKDIHVVVENATLNNVMQSLSERYGFEIKRPENLRGLGTVSAQLSGSLRSVLENILRYCSHCNYLIVPSPSNRNDITKIIFLKSVNAPVAVPSSATESEAPW